MSNHPNRGTNTYDIRVPGCTAWTTMRGTIHAARQEAQKAKQVTGKRHNIYRHLPDDERERVE
ncbi:hypothetical protein [Natronospira bacteriovora]|uniref:Uncharacterized protein n=1 Tax=Natronospira bacteriovora TaxID=3069753 RepID=A0ABU0W6A8_9GAMM|nr:hypothetical protein [Natronospira sp. AB-CW4]MDQ2069298.1 hypothetical protein [Natronospira sp. AB-CW4]